MNLKIGIAGARGLSTVLGFRSIPGVSVTALCDLNEELLAEQSVKFHIPKTYRIFEDKMCIRDRHIPLLMASLILASGTPDAP